MQVDGKVFLVSGAASGLGAATARMLVAAGGRVMLLDREAQAVAELALELGDAARFATADVCQADAVQAALADTRQAFGGLHGLVNCAGVVHSEKLLGKQGVHGLESFQRVLQVNLAGSFNLLRLGAELIAQGAPDAEGERGVIVNTASVAAFDGQVGQTAYAASKGAVAALTLPAARELARHGIRVMCIAPGVFETPMLAGLSDPVRAALAADVPFPPRLGRASEFAALVRHIVENSMLNGEVIRLDGALRMAAR
jgi:NAD(P)-dependent dehydrogenase (short-subunit alcohol dehydrogenase family)